MLKSLVLKYWPLVLLIVLICAVFCMSRYAENRETEHQDNAQANNPKVVIPTSNNSQSAQNANKPHQHPDWIDTFTWPEGATVWALFLTLLVIAWQSAETRAAAQSAERQIALQSIAMRQWVNVEPIQTVTPPNFKIVPEVSLEFKVLNKTDYLITIKKIVAESFHGGKARIFTVSCDVPVPPGKSSVDGGHPFYVTAFVNRGAWDTDGALIFVGGEVTYLDCMEIERTQTFRDLFQGYGDGRLLRKNPSGIVPEVTDYKGEEANLEQPMKQSFSWFQRKAKEAPKAK